MINASPIKLAPTAAFVVDLAKNYFLESPLTTDYLQMLDLSSAEPLLNDHKQAGIYDLSCELLCNRKFGVRQAILDEVTQADCSQLVILAAGLSPVGLEALRLAPGKISKVFEIDASFSGKQQIIERLDPTAAERFCFVEADIRSRTLISSLRGFNPNLPTIVVLEGISHYLSKEDFVGVLQTFRSHERRNRAVIEYAPPIDTLASWVQPAARTLFQLIEQRYFQEGMTKYATAELKAIAESLGGELKRQYPMNDMERARTGVNRWFKEPNSGWLNVVTISL